MKKIFIPFFLIINFFSLNSQTNISSIISSSNVKSDQKPVQYYSKEAFSMTSLLKELNTNGNPLDYYHWNKSAIGTKLKIEFKNGNTLFNSVNTGWSFGGNSLQAEIGLGKNKMIKQLTVYWPNSEPQIFKYIESNKKYFIKEGGISMSELTYNRIHFNNLKKETHRHLHKP